MFLITLRSSWQTEAAQYDPHKDRHRQCKLMVHSYSWNFRSVSWIIYCLDQDAEISIASFAEDARDDGGYSNFVLLDTHRGKGASRGAEVADAARFDEAAKEVRRLEAAAATRSMKQYTMMRARQEEECKSRSPRVLWMLGVGLLQTQLRF